MREFNAIPLRSIPPGTPVVIGRTSLYAPHRVVGEVCVATIVDEENGVVSCAAPDGSEIRILADTFEEILEDDVVTEDYGRLKLAWDGSRAARRRGVLWSNSLPAGDARTQLAFAIGFVNSTLSGTNGRCAILHVAPGRDGASGTAKLVTLGANASLDFEDVPHDPIGNVFYSRETVRFSLPDDIARPALDELFMATEVSVVIIDGEPVIRASGWESLGIHTERERVGELLPYGVAFRGPIKGFLNVGYPPLLGFDSFRMAADLAFASLQPHEAICAFVPDGSGLCCVVLSTSGAYFHGGDPASDLDGGVTVAGLWTFDEGKPWSYSDLEFGWDSGIDGRWRPATEEDLARHDMTLEEVDFEIASALDEPPRSGRARALVEAALAADAATSAAQPAV